MTTQDPKKQNITLNTTSQKQTFAFITVIVFATLGAMLCVTGALLANPALIQAGSGIVTYTGYVAVIGYFFSSI